MCVNSGNLCHNIVEVIALGIHPTCTCRYMYIKGDTLCQTAHYGLLCDSGLASRSL